MRVDPATFVRWRSAGKRMAYPLYFVTLVVLFTYTLFPSENVAEYLSNRVRVAAPGCSLTIDGLSLAFPPGLSADALVLSHLDREVFAMTGVRVAPRTADLLRWRFAADFEAAAYDGRIRGRIAPEPDGRNGELTVSADLTGVDLGRAPHIREWTGYTVAGRLDGNVRLVAIGNHDPTTAAALAITTAVIDPPAPVMTVDRLRFDRVTADITFDQRTLSILAGTFNGPQMGGRMTGSISLRRPFGASRLALDGWALPHTEFLAKLEGALTASADDRRALAEDGFSFRFAGTWDQPDVTLAPGVPR